MNLKILHLSDILIDAENPQRSDELRAALLDRFRNDELHYLAIAGNLTADGSAASFRSLGELLISLDDGLLAYSDAEPRLHRLIVVPGPKDATRGAPQGSEWDEFLKFHRSFFPVEIAEPPDRLPEAWMDIREHKDLTLIGLPCDGLADPDGTSTRIARFETRLKAILARCEPYRSYKQTRPTVLVGSHLPLGVPEEYGSPAFNSARKLMSDSVVSVDFHLVGRGFYAWLGPEPFGFHHTTLVTRTDLDEESPFPLTGYVVEIPDNFDQRPFKTEVYAHRLTESGWLERGELTIGPILPEKPVLPSGDDEEFKLFQKAFDAVGQLIFPERSDTWIWAVGLPGAGKNSLYTAVKQLDKGFRPTLRMANRVAPFIAASWSSYKEATEVVNAALEKARAQGVDLREAVFFAYDQASQVSPREDLGDKGSLEVLEALRDCLARSVVYIRPAVGGGFDLSMGERRREKTFEIPPLIPSSMVSLVSRSRVPIQSDALGTLTGWFRGYSHWVLEGAKGSFDNRPGAALLCEELEDDLFRSSLRRPKTIRQARDLVDRIRNIYGRGGELVCDEIRTSVQSHFPPQGAPWRTSQSPVVDFSGLLRRVDGNPTISVEDAIDLLERHRILIEIKGRANSFEVAALLPFLVGSSSAPVLPSEEARYFLAYALHLQGFAGALHQAIQDLAQRTNRRVVGGFFSGPMSDLPTPSTRAIKESENLIAVFGDENFNGGKTVRGEVLLWNEAHRGPESDPSRWRVTAIAHGTRMIPPMLGAPIPIYAGSGGEQDVAQIAEQILSEMVFLPPARALQNGQGERR